MHVIEKGLMDKEERLRNRLNIIRYDDPEYFYEEIFYLRQELSRTIMKQHCITHLGMKKYIKGFMEYNEKQEEKYR